MWRSRSATSRHTSPSTITNPSRSSRSPAQSGIRHTPGRTRTNSPLHADRAEPCSSTDIPAPRSGSRSRIRAATGGQATLAMTPAYAPANPSAARAGHASQHPASGSATQTRRTSHLCPTTAAKLRCSTLAARATCCDLYAVLRRSPTGADTRAGGGSCRSSRLLPKRIINRCINWLAG